jgi:methyl-accepting chemotaxis protein
MDGVVYNIVDNSDFITAAYFAVQPDLAGPPYVCEIFFEMTGAGIVSQIPQSYEEYIQTSSPDMEWFYGASNSRAPYWTHIYEWSDGTVMVSYTEPVMVDNYVVGVVGVDIPVSKLTEQVSHVLLYESGFALLSDRFGEFFTSNEFIRGLSATEAAVMQTAARANSDKAFNVTLGGVDYLAATRHLANGYDVYVLAPMSEVSADAYTSLLRFVFIFIIVITIVLIIGYFIGKNIGMPIAALSGFMRRVGESGDLNVSPADRRMLTHFSQSSDEIGLLIKDCDILIKHITDVADNLDTVAGGDLTSNLAALSDSDKIAISLKKMALNLSDMFNEIKSSASQVSAGAKQIADGSQMLATGAIEQASAVGHLSTSISEIANKITSDTDKAVRATELAGVIKADAEKGNRQMDEMTTAMNEINQAGQSIGKVIMIINDIAFQTNILALNAAVEAARVGQHGKGFAVVAEEVRNLAAKSAEAANDTGKLIENSIAKAELGSRITSETAANFAKILTGINESAAIINDIASSSAEQSAGIAQINSELERVTQVVQQNSATAQESAAASQEMSSQSAVLTDLIAQFKLNDSGPALAPGFASGFASGLPTGLPQKRLT